MHAAVLLLSSICLQADTGPLDVWHRAHPRCRDERGKMAERFSLPVLPLRDTVVYPGVAVPISAGRPGTVAAVQEALDSDRRLFAVAQRENVDEQARGHVHA